MVMMSKRGNSIQHELEHKEKVVILKKKKKTLKVRL